MADVILTTEDLTVFGGPSNVSLDVDFGPTGDRGSRIYGVVADPRLSTTPKPQDIQNYDLVINITPSSSDYLTVYQKTGTTINDWIEFASLVPNIKSSKETVTFTGGTATLEQILSTSFVVDAYTNDKFSVIYSIQDDRTTGQTNYPTSGSLDFNIAQDPDGSWVMTITINAVEFNGTSWVAVTGERLIHLFITVV